MAYSAVQYYDESKDQMTHHKDDEDFKLLDDY